MGKITWKKQPDTHDYTAAQNYLSLIFEDRIVSKIIKDFMATEQINYFKAKDILRASDLELLPHDDKHVAKDMKKVKDGDILSPILLIRGDGAKGLALIIADGYHRVCASYWIDEDEEIPCKIVNCV